MTWTIVKKEILDNLTTYRFLLLTGLLALLMIVSVIVTYGDYELRLANYNLLRPETGSASAIIPPNPLSVFVSGLDQNLGRLYEVSLLGIDVHSSQQSINRLFSLFTVPDMLFIIKVVLALVALLFSCDAICGDKETGTLKLTLANGGSRFEILLGKLTGRFLITFVPFLILYILAVIIVSLLPDIKADSIFWIRSGIIGIAAFVYCLVFSSLGIFISSLTARSSTSVIACLAFWIFLVFIIPDMGVAIAKKSAGVPPADRVEMEKRLGNIRAIYEKIQHENEGNAYPRMVEEIKESNRQILENYRPKLNALVRITKSIVRISPAGSLTFLLTDISGTGLLEESDLKDAVSRYVTNNFDKIAELEKGEIGTFLYNRKPLVEIFSDSAVIDCCLLIFFAAGFVVFSMVVFSRYDVR